MLEEAMRLLDVGPKGLQPFDVEDPFNDGLRLEGFLCFKPDHRYGALALLRVGGEPAPQRIFATPKLHYPFGRDGVFRFPPIRAVRIYEKLDGTNVLAYRYHDAEGTIRTTYKLRLHPVLRSSRWGDFLGMWRDLLATHPEIPGLAARNDCAISFEMFGSRNTHLIEYDQPLACSALFGVRDDATPIAPADLDLRGVPSPELLLELKSGDDPVAAWASLRQTMEARNRPVEEDRIAGTEGAVWYVRDHGNEMVLFKCKPESIEAVHWKAGISKNAVMATCWNLFESQDRLAFDTLEPLLLEEYDESEIESFRAHIDECIDEVNEWLSFRDQLLEICDAAGVDFATDRGACMRALAEHLPSGKMRRAFSALRRQFGDG